MSIVSTAGPTMMIIDPRGRNDDGAGVVAARTAAAASPTSLLWWSTATAATHNAGPQAVRPTASLVPVPHLPPLWALELPRRPQRAVQPRLRTDLSASSRELTTLADPGEWVADIIAHKYFFQDGNPPWSCAATLQRCLQVLREFGAAWRPLEHYAEIRRLHDSLGPSVIP
jgi:hypothetical protein